MQYQHPRSNGSSIGDVLVLLRATDVLLSRMASECGYRVQLLNDPVTEGRFAQSSDPEDAAASASAQRVSDAYQSVLIVIWQQNWTNALLQRCFRWLHRREVVVLSPEDETGHSVQNINTSLNDGTRAFQAQAFTQRETANKSASGDKTVIESLRAVSAACLRVNVRSFRPYCCCSR